MAEKTGSLAAALAGRSLLGFSTVTEASGGDQPTPTHGEAKNITKSGVIKPGIIKSGITKSGITKSGIVKVGIVKLGVSRVKGGNSPA